MLTINSAIVSPIRDGYENNNNNNLRGDKSLIIAMKSMNAADITTQHDNLFKVWFCVFPYTQNQTLNKLSCCVVMSAAFILFIAINNNNNNNNLERIGRTSNSKDQSGK